MQYCQQQAQVENTPTKLFDQIAVLYFEPEQTRCPVDHQMLQVSKTYKRLIKTIGVGMFWAHLTVRYCKNHPELGSWKSKELDELVAPNSNVTYDVIVEVGKLRFMENRQVIEIQWLLLEKHSLEISTSEIELLIDKFIFYLTVVHQQSTTLINEQIKAQGGYILHLDATCEGDSPKLVSSVDSVSGFVLYSAKVSSENKEELITFLMKIKSYFATPHAVVSDMSKAIKAAVAQVFGSIPHYICHFHFMAAIGKLLFEKEHIVLRKALSKAGISGKLKTIRRDMPKAFQTLSIDDIEKYLAKPEKLGKTIEATEMLVYYLVLWILDHPSEGNGYGFPFDQRYLNFYERLQTAQTLLNEVKAYYPTATDNDAIVWKLYHLMQIPLSGIDDSTLKKTVAQYKAKLVVFSDLRKALAVAPESTRKGFRQNSETTSPQELKKIKTAVQAFMDSFEIKIESTTNKSLRANFVNVKERIKLYWDRLFADPFVVDVNGEKKIFFVQRTNNIMEQQFRSFAYSYRRIHGNHSIRRNLENIPEALPLVANLKNPDYVKLVFEDETKIAKRFSKINIQKIRTMSENHYSNKKKKNTQKIKKVLRCPAFQKQLKAAFADVAE